MNSTLSPLPAPRGMGCLGKGCITVVCLFLFLVVAFLGGGMWALNRVRHTYSSSEPLALPQTSPTEPPVRETPPPPLPDPVSRPVPTPEAPIPVADVQARWKAFEKAAKRGQKASIELTAAEINALIANSSKLRGKGYVSIENNVGHVKVSVPLNEITFMNGRYLNVEASVQASPDGDPNKARISSIILGNQSVPDDVLDRRLFGWTSIRGSIQKWLADENIAEFRIENGRVF